ncbi:MAG: 4-hydroxythreonine-4-phosphate dehydrogenase PdxA [Candidatus Omnitrophota bacterium]
MTKPLIYITMGDPSGIGPEVIIKALAGREIKALADFVVIGDSNLLREEARALGEELMNIEDPDPSHPLKRVIPGKPTEEGAKKGLKSLDKALELIRALPRGQSKALVTAPVSKELINRVYPGFTGHTEYLRDAFSLKSVTMVLTGRKLCVVPVTRHIPLKAVPLKLTKELILTALLDVAKNRELICAKKDVTIGVCALNPHSGEGGSIGREEIEIISPAIKEAKKFYPKITGPISADTIFYKAFKKQIDIVVSMYHDQGLAPFKMVDFDYGVNLTLGLPFIRTSPDHGTAFDIAGKGIADSKSMEEAIKLALRAVRGRE